MKARYRKIDGELLLCPKWERLSSDARFLLLYGLTSPRQNASGVLEATRTALSFDTGLKPKRLVKGLSELVDAGYVVRVQNDAIWFVDFFRLNCANPDFAKTVLPEIDSKYPEISVKYRELNRERLVKFLGDIPSPPTPPLTPPQTPLAVLQSSGSTEQCRAVGGAGATAPPARPFSSDSGDGSSDSRLGPLGGPAASSPIQQQDNNSGNGIEPDGKNHGNGVGELDPWEEALAKKIDGLTAVGKIAVAQVRQSVLAGEMTSAVGRGKLCKTFGIPSSLVRELLPGEDAPGGGGGIT